MLAGVPEAYALHSATYACQHEWFEEVAVSSKTAEGRLAFSAVAQTWHIGQQCWPLAGPARLTMVVRCSYGSMFEASGGPYRLLAHVYCDTLSSQRQHGHS